MTTEQLGWVSRKMMTAGAGCFLFSSLLCSSCGVCIKSTSDPTLHDLQCYPVELRFGEYRVSADGLDLPCRYAHVSSTQLPGPWSGRVVGLLSSCADGAGVVNGVPR